MGADTHAETAVLVPGQVGLGKLVLRLDVDLSIWRIGYANYGWEDHGLYAGRINVQFEHDKPWKGLI
jgi:hypothetical protein